jgi:hypothetical protein
LGAKARFLAESGLTKAVVKFRVRKVGTNGELMRIRVDGEDRSLLIKWEYVEKVKSGEITEGYGTVLPDSEDWKNRRKG